MPVAFSYLRYSHPQQGTGDTVRRQTAVREKWLADHPDVTLDQSLVMTDAGRSAFHREDWDTYALAKFVECIKSGRVERGSFLLVENLDRISRENAGEATELFLSIVNKGITVVQLMPSVMEFARPVNMHSLMYAVMELSRGHSESAAKSERVGAAWARKRKDAANRVVTRRLPGWIRYDDGRLTLDPAKAATVRRIFKLAHAGHGTAAIARTLNAEGVPVLGRTQIAKRGQGGKDATDRDMVTIRWNETVVYHILKSRATFGEFQPSKGRGSNRKPDGNPVANYFPAVITRDEYHATSAALKSRCSHGAGRRGKHINLLSGLLIDARDGGSLTYKHLATRAPAIIPVGAKQGRGVVWASFPAIPLEQAIRSKLVEVTATDISGDDGPARRVEALAGEKAELDSLAEKWRGKMDDPAIVDVVAAKLAEINTRRKTVAEEMADAQREAANPVAESWGEFRTLASLDPKDDTDELRVRIKAALRRSVESIHCLFVGNGRDRIAAVRVQFRGTTYRDYLICYSPGRSNRHIRREGDCRVRSIRWDELRPHKGAELDLRRPDHAAALAELLTDIDLEKLTGI